MCLTGIINRGCVKIVANETKEKMCTKLEGSAENLDDCIYCSTDKCNSSVMMRGSAMLIVLLSIYFILF